MKLLPYGDTGVLIEAAPADVLALRDAALATPGVLDAVPAERTLLVEFDPSRLTADAIAHAVQAARTRPGPSASERPPAVEIAVRYDGIDLDAVAQQAALSAEEVVRRHTSATYTVAFCGFSPGFAYLTGLDPRLHVGRLDRPRTSVPAGAVAIAGPYSGVYPRVSPGGWRLLGRTDARLWDSGRLPPALLPPGAAVRFVRA